MLNMNRSIGIIFPVLLTCFAYTAGTTALAALRRASISGEVQLFQPQLAPTGNRKNHKPQPLRVKLPLTVEDMRTGRIVQSKTIVTDTRFTLSIAPGVYRVSAKIGPPTVNPLPRNCGLPRTVKTHPGKPTFVRLHCNLVG
jgi:hypothetical protein